MKRDVLWYKKPAEKWVEALPLGNGRMGAMVYGKALEEMIQVDESTFWSGEPSEENNRKDNYDIMWKIRKALLDKNFEEADRIGHEYVGRKNQYGTNLPVGHLKINLLDVSEEVTEYERELSLAEAIAGITFKAGNLQFHREVFVSNPAQAVVVRLWDDGEFSLQVGY